MAKHREKVMTKWLYWRNGGCDNVTHFTKELPNYNSLVDQLKNYVKSNHPQLLDLLHSEYIYPEVLTTKEEQEDHPSGQHDRYTYNIHKAALFLEALIEQGDFSRIQQLARASKNGSYEVLMKSFASQNLKGCNFSWLSLAEADFSEANLQDCNFTAANVNDAIFKASNLQNTKITQEQLDSARTYENAKITETIIPFWTDTTKQAVLKHLAVMETYGKKLQEKGNKKGCRASNLANELKNDINATTKYNSIFQEQFTKKLHREDEHFNKPSDHGFKIIVTNVLLAIAGLGVFYAIAGAVHYKLQGKFLFFTNTTTDDNVLAVEKAVIQPMMSTVSPSA